MKLETFIAKQGGDTAVAKKLKLNYETVRKWRILHSSPRPWHAYKLIKLSEGLLTWEDVYLPFAKKRKK